MKTLLNLVIFALATALPASAVVIDFNALASGTVVSGINTISPDLSISTVGGSAVRALVGPNLTMGVIEDTPRSGYRVDFNIAGVSFVSVDLGDFAFDSENIYLRAFDSSNNLLGSSTDFLPANLSEYRTLSVNATNIRYVLFGSDNSSGGTSQINSVLFDNLIYNQTSGVGAPDGGMTILLLGAALCGLAGFKTRLGRG